MRDMTFIAASMRDQDWSEIQAVIPATRTEIGAMLFAWSPGLAWCAWLDDAPVVAFGVSASFNGLGSGWAYGTKRMPKVMKAATLFALRTVKPMLIAQGFRRVEVRTSVDHDLSHKWLERLGFTREGIAVDYGMGGRDFVTYAATRRGMHEPTDDAKLVES